jgi:hypothetical protein
MRSGRPGFQGRQQSLLAPQHETMCIAASVAGHLRVAHRRSTRLTFARTSTAANIAIRPDSGASAPCDAVKQLCLEAP